MEKRAGRYRWHLLLKSQKRGALQGFLAQLSLAVEALKLPRTTRWNLDIDPVELT
jgi:primosomal protein N' (replication factor Y)